MFFLPFLPLASIIILSQFIFCVNREGARELSESVEFAVSKQEGVQRLTAALEKAGAAVSGVSDIPYGYKLICNNGGKDFSLVLYYNAKSPLCTKLVQQGGPDGFVKQLEIKGNGANLAPQSAFASHAVKDIPDMPRHIGTDESGKGDFFGPLVVAGVYVSERTAKLLELLGVQDSKMSSDKKNRELARQIRDMLPPEDIELICLMPVTYNGLYAKMGNLNTLLGWAHSRIIENLLARHEDCREVIADQFASEFVLKRALMERGRRANVLQTPKGERDIAVAAASVLARDEYLKRMEELAKSADLEGDLTLPKGAGENVDRVARVLARSKGKDAMVGFAKLHFKNFDKI